MNAKQEDKDLKPRRILVSLRSLAQMLDTNRSSVRRWLKEVDVRPFAIGRGPNGAIRYRWDEVKAWMESLEQVD